MPLNFRASIGFPDVDVKLQNMDSSVQCLKINVQKYVWELEVTVGCPILSLVFFFLIRKIFHRLLLQLCWLRGGRECRRENTRLFPRKIFRCYKGPECTKETEYLLSPYSFQSVYNLNDSARVLRTVQELLGQKFGKILPFYLTPD